MLVRKLLKGEEINSNYNIQSRNTSAPKVKKSNSTMSLGNKSYLNTSSIQKQKINNSSIYSNIRINKVHSIENSERSIRKITREIRENKMKEINTIYKNELKNSLYNKYGNIYLTNSSSYNKKTNEDTSIIKHDNSNSTTNINNSNFIDNSVILSLLPPIENPLAFQKIEFEIGELYGDKRSGSKLAECSRKIYILHNYIKFKRKRMEQEEEMKNNEINKINQVYSSLVNNKNCFLDKYCRTYDGYLKFLKSKINNEKQNLEDLIDKQYNLQYEVNQLLSETIKKQEKLEEYVEKKDLIFKIKLKQNKMPIERINKSFKETRIAELGALIQSLQSKIDTGIIEKFMKHYAFVKKGILKINQVEKLELIDSISESSENQSIQKIPFKNVDDFMHIFTYLKNRNMNLLLENEEIRNLTKNYQIQYDEIEKESNIAEDVVQKLINEKYEKFKQLRMKNEKLQKKLFFFQNQHISISTPHQKLAKVSGGSFINREMINLENYKTILSNYKIEYLYMMKKLFEFIENFVKLKYGTFNYQKVFTYIKQDDYYKYMKMKFTNENGKDIQKIILKLILIYEKIVENVFNKQNQYINDAKSKQKTIQLIIENQKKAKIDNARIIRLYLEHKRDEVKENIIHKNSKIIFNEKRKCKQFPQILIKKEKRKRINKSVESIIDTNECFRNMMLYSEE